MFVFYVCHSIFKWLLFAFYVCHPFCTKRDNKHNKQTKKVISRSMRELCSRLKKVLNNTLFYWYTQKLPKHSVCFWQPINSSLIQGLFVKLTKFKRRYRASIGVGKFITDMEAPSRTRNSTGLPSMFLNSLNLSLRSLVCKSLIAVG